MSLKSLNNHDTEKRSLSEKIKAEAHRLGFFACGIAKAEPVDDETAAVFKKWLSDGNHADMAYMANNLDKRLDPTLLMPGAESIVCVALNYSPKEYISSVEYQLAAYAYGQDYHDVMRSKLNQLAATLPSEVKICCDTVPILERYWAEKAGIGWIGRNHQLIIPQAGSMFFLGEIITTETLYYDSPAINRCGNCHACTDACPTGAIVASGGTLNACKCLSYLTIENRGPIADEYKKALGNSIYGCDRCQNACPWNRFACATEEERFLPSKELLEMKRDDWNNLTVEDYRVLFKGSAVKRAKYEGLMRNISIAKENNR